MEKKRSFSIKDRLQSFVYAFKGIAFIYKTEKNIYIHTFVTIMVIIMGFILKVSKVEWCFLIISIGMVFTAEAFNTAIEHFIDFISPGYRYSAGKSKDMAAAAVLFAAITAAVVGLVIFLPKIIALF